MVIKKDFDADVIVVGSGAGGGAAAYVLAVHGVKVIVVEAGRDHQPATETPMFQLPSDAPLRNYPTPDRQLGFLSASIGGWKIPGEPYRVRSFPTDDGQWHEGGEIGSFRWFRDRMLGGRTNHWGRISPRYGPDDFKGKTRDGLGVDWPITYDEVAPYYEKVERLIGVFGSNEGMENCPDSAPGVLLPPPGLRAYELLFKKGCSSTGLKAIPTHGAILTKALDYDKIAKQVHPGNELAARALAYLGRTRAPCFYATPCIRGCSIGAAFQSPTVFLPAAQTTGNLQVITGAMVRSVEVNAQGKASGILYIEKKTGLEQELRARVVVLSASTCETARILLNSRSRLFPDGLGNSSGQVGRNLTDNLGTSITAQIPALENLPPMNDDGVWTYQVYAPWARGQKRAGIDFPRGYMLFPLGGRRMPHMNSFLGLEEHTSGSYGRKFRDDCRRYYGSIVTVRGQGEMIPNEGSYCELDPDLKDKWGIPTLRFRWHWSEHEKRQTRHVHQTIQEVLEGMGAVKIPTPKEPENPMDRPGAVIHELGSTRMGAESSTSVLNSNAQTWDVKNVFVADGGVFASNPEKNPTLTIMALAWRTSEYIVSELRRGSL